MPEPNLWTSLGQRFGSSVTLTSMLAQAEVGADYKPGRREQQSDAERGADEVLNILPVAEGACQEYAAEGGSRAG